MNKVLKITNKEDYRDLWNHRMKPCLALSGRSTNTCCWERDVPILAVIYDILYIKNMHVNSVRHISDEKILQLYIILVVSWAGIFVLEAFESSKIHCPGDKSLCMGSE